MQVKEPFFPCARYIYMHLQNLKLAISLFGSLKGKLPNCLAVHKISFIPMGPNCELCLQMVVSNEVCISQSVPKNSHLAKKLTNDCARDRACEENWTALPLLTAHVLFLHKWWTPDSVLEDECSFVQESWKAVYVFPGRVQPFTFVFENWGHVLAARPAHSHVSMLLKLLVGFNVTHPAYGMHSTTCCPEHAEFTEYRVQDRDCHLSISPVPNVTGT